MRMHANWRRNKKELNTEAHKGGACCNFLCFFTVLFPFLVTSYNSEIGPLCWFYRISLEIIGLNVGLLGLKCKRWNNLEKQLAVIPKRRLLMSQHVGSDSSQKFVAFCWKGSDKYLVNAVSEHPFESEPSNSPLKSLQASLDAFYRFSRPHTVIGTVRFRDPAALSWH